ncbi:probable helicase with zinc finger domain isoform X2 [Mya arenaria]|uniref:probable helicase with zinc finger domain isoform X2 n=1 Tax=Mya arenaria TaxID=6604 RepID=UPI0022E3A827|nr:probable helicase with zinc finger domain isoform X2 [Mya arenaria]
MTLENQIKLGQFRNWVRSSIGLRCLRDGLLDYVTTSTEDQYKTFVKYLKRRAKISTFTCDKCQLCNLLPLHALEKKRCNQRHVNYCNCKRQSDKRVCPEGGACGIFYDCVTDEHFEHDPSWCNTSVELWSTNSFEFMKCFISTPGYKNKRSISLIDASGLISICLNNRRLRASFNDISDLLKKVKDYRNDILHSGDLKVSNDRLKEYLKDMKQILQHSELEENEAAQKELKTLERLETDELAITSQDDINMRKDALKAIIEREIELKLNLSEEDTLRTEVKTPFTSDSDKTENMPLTKDDETDVKTILTAGVKDKIEKELAQLSVAEEKHYNSIETTLQKVENEIIKVKETVRTHRSDLDEIKTGLLSQQNVLRSLSEEQQRQSKVLEETYDLVGDVHATGKETHSATLSTQKAVLESSNEVREILERVRRIDAQTTVPEQRLTVKITKTDRNGEKELSQRLVDICNSIVNMETIPPEKRTQIRHCLTMALNEIGKDGNEITAFKPECLAIYVRCKSLQTWVDLCEKCLAHELTQAFKAVENEVRRLTGLENVQLDVVIYEEDFLKSVNAIVASTNTDVARTLQTSSGRKRYQICFTFESSSDSDESSTARDEPTSNDNMMTGDFLDDVDDNEDSCEIEKELIEIEHLEHQNKELQMTQEDVKDTFVCNSCKNKFRTSAELSDHQAKYSNMNNFLSEERLKWTQRSPPRGVKLEKYTLCERFSKKKACPYGDKCIKPHTDCELTEWNQSLESMRQLILHIGENVEDLSLGYSLYKMCKEEKQMKATKPELDFVRIDALSELKVHTITKRFKNSWPFEIKSEYSLKRVCLTDQEASTYYNIENITDTTQKKDVCYDRSQLKDECQEWTNPKFVFNRKGQYKYRIKVAFQTEIYGTFCQNIIFDFGKSELLLKQLAVESAPVTSVDEVRGKFEKQCKRRWQEEDVNVVKFFERTDEDERGIGLKKQYPLEELLHKEFPDSLSRENYTAWMHMMLYAEEQARLEEISKFNIKTSLVLEDRLEPIDNPTSETLFANDGELLARIGLNDELSVDSIAGKLILRQSHMIWIAPVTIKRIDAMTKMSVYEARIEHRERDFIDVELSRQSVEELGLQCRQEFEVEIQFQLDRILFWEMHRAVDNLRQLDFVFPPLLNTKDFQKATSVLERRFVNKGMDELNPNQMTAVVKSSCTLKSATPPFLIVGPYGTGKTYTIAQAVKYIIKQSSKSRVLISTCSNSEADAYIKDYMHPFVETGNPEARPLRIYYRYRWRSTVSETVLAYCLLEEEGEHKGTFRSPTKDELLQHRVIVTTLHTAKLLTYLELTEDVFTHIFIDEAAQALECDLLIPLSLAGPKTRIILAGDHMQLSPDVYSKIGKQEQFQISMLERLVEYYIVDSPFVVTLCDNYRSTKEIIDFTSALFYDNRLKAVKNPPQHSVYYPLTFFTARGKEIMPDLKTGYYNESEVYEVVDQVEHFYQYWPPEWGKFDGKSICVVSTYKMQVQYGVYGRSYGNETFTMLRLRW